MYEIANPADHPFEPGQTVWFKGGHHAVANPTFAGFQVGDKVTVTQILTDDDGDYVRLAEDAEQDDEDNAPVWNVSWFTDDEPKTIRTTPTVQEDDMTETTTNRPPFKPGDLVRVRETFYGDDTSFCDPQHEGDVDMDIRAGETYKVERASNNGSAAVLIEVGDEMRWLSQSWFDLAEAEEETTTNRVEIDFSGSSRATARQYAADLQSRVNKPETNAILNAIEHGEPVEAFAAAEALLDAMRHVSTRFGQSMARRRAGEKVAHLGYIVHGVLGNVADGLPAYEQGERSRALADAKQEIANLQNDVRLERQRADEFEERGDVYDEQATEVRAALVEAREEVEAVTEAYNRRGREVEQVRAEAAEQHSRLVAAANDEIDKVKAERDALAAKLSVAEIERDAAAATIGYIAERLEDTGRAEMLGYWTGVKDATLPSSEG